jgi:aubergine-like protein
VVNSFKAYYKANKCKPEHIFIFRDGVGDSMFKQVVDVEFPQIIDHVGRFDRSWKPRFTIVVVNKRINTKIYDAKGAGINNPESGTLVNKDVTGQYFNFYLLSHSAGRGTATPTHYNIVFDNSDLPSDVVENLTYRLCFNYYNWSGAIKVPAPCAYAHKLAYFVGKSTKNEFSDRIREGYFFI